MVAQGTEVAVLHQLHLSLTVRNLVVNPSPFLPRKRIDDRKPVHVVQPELVLRAHLHISKRKQKLALNCQALLPLSTYP